ncbi:hypothetical protein ACA910_014121 [Epithemia clementina (nom. ined.)]
METIHRMRGTSSAKKSTNNKGDRASSTLRTINLSANVQTALPLIISSSYQATKRKMIVSRKLKSQSSTRTGQPLRFESPRLELTDSEVFPSKSELNELTDPEERWKVLKEQAGSHQQDGSVLRLRPNVHTPKVLKCGMPPQAAARVLELHVKVSGETLPAWMDAIASTFVNLQHLYVSQSPEEERENEVQHSVNRTSLARNKSGDSSLQNPQDEEEAKKVAEHSNRLKRLYILYRLPDLVSIDGSRVSAVERKLARPDDPNGERVNRNEWVKHDDNADIKISLLDGDECVEVNVFRQDANESSAEDKIEDSPSSVTHREKSVEVDLAGKLLEVDMTMEGGSKTPGMNSKQESRNSEDDTASLRCGPMILPENASVVTDDCEWSAACGLAMWRKTSSFNTHLGGEKSKTNKTIYRRSSSWKDCRKLVAARVVAANSFKPRIPDSPSSTADSIRLSPLLEPAAYGGIYQSASRKSQTNGSSASPNTKSTLGIDRFGPVAFADSGENEMITRETTPRRSFVNNKLRNAAPRLSLPSQPAATTIAASKRVSSSKSLTSPFPMQFRDKMAIPATLCPTTLAVVTSEVCIDSNENGTPPPVPPPPPTSKTSSSANMETIDFAFSGGAESTRSAIEKQQKGRKAERGKAGLPPPCPAGNSPKDRMKLATQRVKRKKKRQGLLDKWKEQQSARSTSIMDGEDDTDDDDDESCVECTDSESTEGKEDS